MPQPRLLSFVALVLLLACGGRGGGGARDGSDAGEPGFTPTLVIAPASTRLIAGDAPLELSATLSGASVEIVWSLDGPGSLSSSSGTRVSYTPPATVGADAQATVTASGGGATAMASILVARAPERGVAGRVVDGAGLPVAGITVVIGERSTVTDGAGRFSLEEIDVPYSLTAFSVQANEVLLYEGLTRRDPSIVWRQRGGAHDRTAQVAGTIVGGVPPSTAGVQTLVSFFSTEAQTQGDTIEAGYALPLSWNGQTSTTGTVRALQLMRPTRDGLPSAYTGYGVRTGVTVLDGTTLPGADVALTPPAVSSVRGSYLAPAGFTIFARFVGLSFEDGAFLSLGFDDSSDLEFAYLTPVDIGASVAVIVEAVGPGTTVVRRQSDMAPGASSIVLGLPLGAPIVAPADGADPVDAETEFSWGPFSGGVFVVDFISPGSGPTFHVVTSATRTTLPRVPALPVPSRVQYGWTVTASAPFESVDDVAGPRLFRPEGGTSLQSFADGQAFTTR